MLTGRSHCQVVNVNAIQVVVEADGVEGVSVSADSRRWPCWVVIGQRDRTVHDAFAHPFVEVDRSLCVVEVLHSYWDGCFVVLAVDGNLCMYYVNAQG